MNADLSQAIQQFNLLSQAAANAQSAMGGSGGGGMAGGMGGGMGGGGMPSPYPMGGGRGGGRGGVGSAPSNPLSTNRGSGGGVGSRGGLGAPQSAWGGGITSSMFGLSQIGFAMEDYQYAGWRGAMNNVPWIAQAAGNMAGAAFGVPGLGQAALLATAIGVPLANAAWQGQSPEARNNISQSLFGGTGASQNELARMRNEEFRKQFQNMETGNANRFGMEATLAERDRNSGLRQSGMDMLTRDYRLSSDETASRRATYQAMAQSRGEAGAFSNLRSSINTSLRGTNINEVADAHNMVSDEWSKMDALGRGYDQFSYGAGDAMQFTARQFGWTDSRESANDRRVAEALTRVKTKKVNSSDKLLAEIAKIEQGLDPDWDLVMKEARLLGPTVIKQMMELKASFDAAKATVEYNKQHQAQLRNMTPEQIAAQQEGGSSFTGPLPGGMQQQQNAAEVVAAANQRAAEMTSGERRRASSGGSEFTGPLTRQQMMDKANESQTRALGRDTRQNQRDREMSEMESYGDEDLKQSTSNHYVNLGYSRDVADQKADQVIGNRNAVIGAKDARDAGKHSALIRSTAKATGVNRDVSGEVQKTLTEQGVDAVEAKRIGDQVQDQDAMDRDARKNPDQRMFDQYHDVWIRTIKSDMLQAGRAAKNRPEYNEYLKRIKAKISDDLKRAGISRNSLDRFTELLYNEAHRDAIQAFDDAKSQIENSNSYDGIKQSDGAVNQRALMSLQGEMSNDLNAVYGNASTNTFYMQRMYQQQIRRQRMRMNRFAR